MTKNVFEVRHIRWWHRPVPLYAKKDGNHVRVGWVWNQRAYVVRNLALGWVAFVDQQTPENIDVWHCPQCGALLWGSTRSRIIDAIKREQQ